MRTVLTLLAWIAVLTVGTVTAAANFRYGWLIAHDEERWIYAVGGTVLDVVKTFLPLMLGTFLSGRLTAGTFLRQLVGWTFWGFGIVWSITCALGLYSISKEAGVGDTLGKQAFYKQLTETQTRKQGELLALANVRSSESIAADLAALKRDRLWARTRECADATATDSRDYCAKADKLRGEHDTARPAQEIRRDRERLAGDLREIETKLAGVNLADVMRKADPATDSLAKLLGWEPDTVKSRLALMLAALFEFTGLLPWIIHGSHGPRNRAVRAHELRQEASEPPTAPAPVLAPVVAAIPAPPLVLPEVDSLAAQWAKATVLRRKGTFVPAAEMFGQFAQWCRANGHEIPTQTRFGKMMTDLGFDRRKIAGGQRYMDVTLSVAGPALKLVADNEQASA